MKAIARLLTSIIMISLLAAACGTKSPADELEVIKHNGRIRVGTSADAPPFESLDEHGQMVGFDIDLVNEIGKRMGLAVEIQNMPYEHLAPALQGGNIDIGIAAFNVSGEPDQNIGYTDAYLILEDGIAAAQRVNHPEIMNQPLAIAVPEGAVELTRALNKTIADMAADGFIEDLSQKHLISRP
jgi:ABC-type amino acid transport substrate-binding protein